MSRKKKKKTSPCPDIGFRQAHGPKYVGEMLDIDLRPYASIPGMSSAMEIRDKLEQYDPLAEKLARVQQCIQAIPGVGDPKAIQAAALIVDRASSKSGT